MEYLMTKNYLKEELYQKIQEETTIFDFIQNGALDGVWYWDLENLENEWMSPKFWETLGYDPNEKAHLSTEWQSIIFEEDLNVARKNLQKHLDDPNHPYDQIVRYKHKNGSTVWIRCRGLAIRDINGKPIRMLGAHTDITDHKNVLNTLQHVKEDYEMVFNTTQDAMFLVDVLGPNQFKYIRTNKTHQEKTGIPLDTIKDKTPAELLGVELGKIISQNYQKCVDQRKSIVYEEVLELPAGRGVWHTTLSPVFSKGEVSHIVGSAADITKRKALEDELKYRANYDSLTGLANRDLLYAKIKELIEESNQEFIFAFIDLNDFKSVNDRYGHKVGDEFLKQVADRLTSFIDHQDLVSRLGGDEFVIVKPNIEQNFDIDKFKKDVLEHISKPVVCNEYAFKPSAAIGVAHYPKNGSNYDQLFIYSDQEMYKMKKVKIAF
jgi:diguanylate cyclase (GGDEF)-like protein/PAS domain S-box-containing protein